MKTFEYADQWITEREIAYAVPSMVIGIGILTLPRVLSQVTNFSDGYISIFIAGIIVIVTTWLIALLPTRFPGQSFFSYTSLIVSKPISAILTVLVGGHFLLFSVYEVRMVSIIAKHYLFDLTPIEFISLFFLLIVIYAAAGSRVGILRLNLMFLPIIVVITFFVVLFNIGLMEGQNVFPLFESPLSGYVNGVKESYFSFAGGGILLFYVSMVKKPSKVPKYAALSMILPTFLYIMIHLACIFAFSYEVSGALLFPTVELAKEVEIPGGFFERFEAVFFTIWIMAIFNTTAMAFDVSVMAFSSLLPKLKKLTWILILTPIVYIASMMPQNFNEVSKLGEYLSYLGFSFSTILPIILLLIAKIRGVKGNEKSL